MCFCLITCQLFIIEMRSQKWGLHLCAALASVCLHIWKRNSAFGLQEYNTYSRLSSFHCASSCCWFTYSWQLLLELKTHFCKLSRVMRLMCLNMSRETGPAEISLCHLSCKKISNTSNLEKEQNDTEDREGPRSCTRPRLMWVRMSKGLCKCLGNKPRREDTDTSHLHSEHAKKEDRTEMWRTVHIYFT